MKKDTGVFDRDGRPVENVPREIGPQSSSVGQACKDPPELGARRGAILGRVPDSSGIHRSDFSSKLIDQEPDRQACPRCGEEGSREPIVDYPEMRFPRFRHDPVFGVLPEGDQQLAHRLPFCGTGLPVTNRTRARISRAARAAGESASHRSVGSNAVSPDDRKFGSPKRPTLFPPEGVPPVRIRVIVDRVVLRLRPAVFPYSSPDPWNRFRGGSGIEAPKDIGRNVAIYLSVNEKVLFRWNNDDHRVAAGSHEINKGFIFDYVAAVQLIAEGFHADKTYDYEADRLPYGFRGPAVDLQWKFWPSDIAGDLSLGSDTEVLSEGSGSIPVVLVGKQSEQDGFDLYLRVEFLAPPIPALPVITGVEVTQGIQHFWSKQGPDNSLPIIEARLTLVRAYVEVPKRGKTTTIVGGSVHIGGTDIWGDPILEKQSGVLFYDVDVNNGINYIDRDAFFYGSVNFYIIPQKAGVLSFTVTVASKEGSATQVAHVECWPPPPLPSIGIALIDSFAGTPAPYPVDRDFQQDMWTLFEGAVADIPRKLFEEWDAPHDFPKSVGMIPAAFPIIPQDLELIFAPNQATNHGLIDNTKDWVDAKNEVVDKIAESLPSAQIRLAVPSPTFKLQFPNVGGVESGVFSKSCLAILSTVAHELGHAFGLDHAPGLNAPAPDPFFFPRDGRIRETGVDVLQSLQGVYMLNGSPQAGSTRAENAIKTGASVDFMGYSSDDPQNEVRWISPYHWVKIYHGFAKARQ